VLKLTS